MKKIICFDVDGTLVDGISWMILSRAFGLSRDGHMSIYRGVKSGAMTLVEAEQALRERYNQYFTTGKATKEYMRKILFDIPPKPEAKAVVQELKARGYHVYLISGAISMYVAHIAELLGADGFYASSDLLFDTEENLTQIVWTPYQGKAKLEHLQIVADTHKVSLTDIVFVGDSDNDIEVFKATKHGVAISSTDPDLRQVAWREIETLSELPELLDAA